MRNKTYEISKISDFLKIPSDRIEDCMAELAQHLKAVKSSFEMIDIDPSHGMSKLVWTDDGKEDLNIKISCEDSNEPPLQIQVIKNKSDDHE